MLRFPTLFVCGFIGLAAVQSLFAGLMLANMAHNKEHPVIMYLRHTYDAELQVTDTFTAGNTDYVVYCLR